MTTKTAVILFLIFCALTTANAQKVQTGTTTEGDVYAVISAEGMPKGYETVNPANLYYQAPLYQYMATGTDPVVAITDGGGNQAYAARMVRHYQTGASSYYRDGSGNWIVRSYNPNQSVSALFAVAPADIYPGGATVAGGGFSSPTMSWATANGFLLSGNSNAITIESSATPMGCSQYTGKSGNDPVGSWRVPTQKELMLMYVLRNSLLSTAPQTGFVSFAATTYWSATEGDASSCWYVIFSSGTASYGAKTGNCRVRCVRDL